MKPRQPALIIFGATLFFTALFVHLFYVEYRASYDELLLQIGVADKENEVTEKQVQTILQYDAQFVYATHKKWFEDNVPLSIDERTAYEKASPSDKVYGFGEAIKTAYLDKTWAVEKVRENWIQEARLAIVPYGMTPSKNIEGTLKKRKRDAFWLGLMLPVLLVAGSLSLFATYFGFRSPKRKEDISGPVQRANMAHSRSVGDNRSAFKRKFKANEATIQDPQSLAELLLVDFGADFPVSSGNAERHDPLRITAENNYVGIEYAVVKHVLGIANEDYKLAEQQLIGDGERQIDELVFDVKPAGKNEWTGQRRFYFDITAGFSALES